MTRVLKGSMLFCACVTIAKLLTSETSVPGSPVSDELAAALKGGCAGIKKPTCTKKSVCSVNGYINGQSAYDLNSVATTYCTKTSNGKIVCNNSSAGYVSCGG
jgi:hypothetical protein